MQDFMHATRGYPTWRGDLTLVTAATRFGAVLDDLVAIPNTPCYSLQKNSQAICRGAAI